MTSRVKTFAATATLALALAPAAAAQPAVDAYNKPSGKVEQQVDQVAGLNEKKPPSARPAQQGARPVGKAIASGELPFTGLDILLLVGAGGALLGIGLGLRRVTRLQSS